MKLWSIQPLNVTVSSQDAVCYSMPDFVELDGTDPGQSMQTAYSWMVLQMQARLPVVKEAQWPWWAWVVPEWPCKDGSPNLRYYREDKEVYLLELEIPESHVLMSDYILWHQILNRGEITLYEGEEITIARSTWSRVFDVTAEGEFTLCADPSWVGCSTDRSIQACFWELRPEYIVSVTPVRAHNQRKLRLK